jgi:two-component system phosphate regulon sensor histidine kinase PhoR
MKFLSKILITFIILSVTPVIFVGFLIVGSYESIIDKYLPYQEMIAGSGRDFFSARETIKIQIEIIIVGVLFLAIIVGVLFSRSITRPLKKISRKIQENPSENFNFKKSSLEEINELGSAFNKMADVVKKEKHLYTKEQDKISSIINNLTDGLMVLNNENKIVMINPKAEKMLGVKARDVLNLQVTDELTNIPSFRNLSKVILFPISVSRLKRTGEPIINEVKLFAPEEIILEVISVPILNKDGEVYGFMEIFHDITREKTISKMKSEFISITAHQLRTPLSAIKWTLKMFLDGDIGRVTAEQKDFLERAYNINERMIKLINDLLNVSRIEEGKFLYKFSLSSLEKIIQETVDLLSKQIGERKVKFSFQLPTGPLPKIRMDSVKIRIAIHNLLDNAIRYTPSGGEVTLEAKFEQDKIQIKISDSGVGIPESEQNRIFTKFYRGSNVIKMQTEGSGLGLFIVKNIIERHKGKICFESRTGGTVFYITLPIYDELIKKK